MIAVYPLLQQCQPTISTVYRDLIQQKKSVKVVDTGLSVHKLVDRGI